jgi:hypothetical protein
MSRLSERKPLNKQESFFEENYRLKQEAKELARKFKDIKIDKKLLK